jgi:hypothetical protein
VGLARRLGVVVVMVVVVSMAVTGQLQHGEAQTGGDENAAHDRVLGILDGRAELQSHGDDHTTQHDRDQYMGRPGQAGQPGYPGQRVAPGPAQHGQRHPVVRQDGVAEAHAGRGGQQRRSVLGHLLTLPNLMAAERLPPDTGRASGPPETPGSLVGW